MPIKFRCPHCRQFLGISPDQAGQLSDCPACGRTVRVPNLDGTVAPLPAAKIDLRDAQLANALTALSQIGAPVGSGSVATLAPAPAATTTTISRAPQPVAVAVPVTPPLEPKLVAPAPQTPTSATTADLVPSLLIDFDPTPVEVTEPRRARRTGFPRELRIAAVVLIVAIIFMAGLLTGRAVERRSGPSTTDPGPARQNRAAKAAEAAAPVVLPSSVPAQGIGGTLSWQAADGQRQPDSGARIIAVPEQPPGGPPLFAAGYRTGAVSVDRERAVDAIRKLGGDYAIADAHGRYVLQLPAGRYQILFLSRHLSRNSEQPLDLHLNSILASFFDQPQGLVGSVLVESQAIEFDGRPRVLDHAFGR